MTSGNSELDDIVLLAEMRVLISGKKILPLKMLVPKLYAGFMA